MIGLNSDKNQKSLMQKNTFKTIISAVLAACIINTTTLAETPQKVNQQSSITLSVPSTIDILAINGQPYQSPSLIEGNYLIALPQGTRSLVAQYYENWDTVDESGNIIRWKPVELIYAFDDASHYSLEHTTVSDIDDAESLINTPEIWLSSSAQRVANGVLVKQAETKFFVRHNTINAQTASKETGLTTQIQAPQQEIHTRKHHQHIRQNNTIEHFSFADWKAFKKANPDQYQRFKDYQEYQDFLKYRHSMHQ